MSLGPWGAISRLILPAAGSRYTYTFLNKPTASGQVDVATLKSHLKVYYPCLTMNKIVDAKYSKEEIQRCIDLLDDLVKNSVELAHLSKEQRIAILKAAGEISRPDRDEIRKRKKDRIRLKKQRIDDHERKIRRATGIRAAREKAVFTAPKAILHADKPERFSGT